MDWIKQNQSWLLRFASVASLVATLGWFLWPTAGWKVDPGALVALGAALGVWLWQEGLNFPAVRTPHPHDIALLRKVRAIIGPGQVQFLKEHDLSNSFRQDHITFLWEIADTWNGIYWEFHDKRLQSSFDEFVSKARTLAYDIALKSHPSNHFSSIVPPGERDWFSKETSEMVAKFNERATEVGNLYEGFERIARDRLPEAFLTMPDSKQQTYGA